MKFLKKALALSISILCFNSIAHADVLWRWNTVPVFQELYGADSGVGTDTAMWGGQTNSAELLGASGAGQIPHSGNLFTFFYFNGVSFSNSFTGGIVRVRFEECFFFTENPNECFIENNTGVPDVEVSFSYTATTNTDDPIASADGLFFSQIGKGGWVLENTGADFAITFQRHSPAVPDDLILLSGDGYVSIGNVPVPEPVQVPEPASFALLALGILPLLIRLQAKRGGHVFLDKSLKSMSGSLRM